MCGFIANSEDPDRVWQNMAFNQDLHCLLTQNQSSEKKYNFFFSFFMFQLTFFQSCRDGSSWVEPVESSG